MGLKHKTVAQIKKNEKCMKSEYEDAGEYYHDIFEFDCTGLQENL